MTILQNIQIHICIIYALQHEQNATVYGECV
jgi:hypothetical protein